jgi:hypothetical protein
VVYGRGANTVVGSMSYDDWTVPQLKEECARRTLKTTGPKEHLADRLEAYDQCARDVVQQRQSVVDGEGAFSPGSPMDESDDVPTTRRMLLSP